MKIISLHIRGLGSETKLNEVHERLVLDIQGTLDGDFSFVEATGNSGGHLTVWNRNTFHCEFVVKKDNFLAVVGKWDKIEGLVGCVNVYGPNDVKGRQRLWSKLDLLCDKEEVKSIFFGDFNEVRDKHERLNSELNSRGAKQFIDFIHRNGLINIRMGGNKFMRISDNGVKFSKLDRFLTTSAFEKLWRNIRANMLERKWSDHVLIGIYDMWRDFGPPPFKFFDVWLLDKKLEEVVAGAWQVEVKSSGPDCIFRDKLKNMKLAGKEWRKLGRYR
ncbi:hypothetical protein OSB04_un000346 [Centaurea solstitialis]|uniref:Endonuclease/exonuclease/phosphatase domain-containing protein n=1 Tax=Centaurea solstitialis TaxID=347529 RepID=A0AA38W3S6_9ASTR|nr:hypothetical protein OSB04_un000346 [Centaurea solstitialis]